MDVVDTIASVPVGGPERSSPVEPIRIQAVAVREE
jgi:hypothetical protein